MKLEKEKEMLLECLRQNAIVGLCCKRTNIGRATFYRWKKEDAEFAKLAEGAIFEGENLITEMSESQLISLIKDRNFQAVQLWLKHHHPKYANKIELSGNINIKEEPLTPEQEMTIKEALRLADLPGKDEDSSKNNGNNESK